VVVAAAATALPLRVCLAIAGASGLALYISIYTYILCQLPKKKLKKVVPSSAPALPTRGVLISLFASSKLLSSSSYLAISVAAASPRFSKPQKSAAAGAPNQRGVAEKSTKLTECTEWKIRSAGAVILCRDLGFPSVRSSCRLSISARPFADMHYALSTESPDTRAESG
jgi:hypothetical protein